MSDPSNELRFDRRTIAKNIATLFSGAVASQGMTALALLITARQLGAEVYGQYTSCFVLAGFTSILFNLGLDIWLLREGSRRREAMAGVLGGVLAIKAGFGLVWFALLSLVAPYLNGLLNTTSFAPHLVRLSALVVWLDCVYGSLVTSYKARLRTPMASLLDAGSDGVWLLVTGIFAGLGIARADLYMEVRLIVLLVSLALALAHVVATVGLQVRRPIVTEILESMAPFAASEFLAWASTRIDVFIIALTMGKLAVGLYSPAVSLVSALFLIPGTVYAVVMPVLSTLFQTHVRQAWMTVRSTLLLLAAVGVAMTVAILFGSEFAISLLGKSYTDAQGLLDIVSFVPFLHSLSFGMAAILVATNQQGRRVRVQVVAVAASAVLNLIILPLVGIRGAAYVYVLTEMILLGGYAWLVYGQYAQFRLQQSSPV